jgi:hypothetical protein
MKVDTARGHDRSQEGPACHQQNQRRRNRDKNAWNCGNDPGNALCYRIASQMLCRNGNYDEGCDCCKES